MTTALDPVSGTVNAATLAPIVQQALNRDTAVLTQWTVEPLQSKRGGGLGGGMIYRVSGSVQDEGELLPWSLILKVMPEPGENTPPSQWSGWRRELDFYRSELTQNLPGLRAASCYAIQEQTDATGRMVYWLWLEELMDETDASWSLEDYHRAARHLGQFNGAFLVDHPLSSVSWLSQRGTRDYVEAAAPWVTRLQENRNHPLVRVAYPPTAIESFLQLWQHRGLYLDTLEQLPQTLCHRDAQRSNLFLQVNAAGRSQLTAIDWSSLGLGNIGLDINQMILFDLYTSAVDVSQATMLDQAIFTGYVDGLRDAGWRADPAWARLGYTAAAIRSRTTGIFRYLQFMLDDERRRQWHELWQARNLTVDEGMASVRQVDLFFSEFIREADELRANLL